MPKKKLERAAANFFALIQQQKKIEDLPCRDSFLRLLLIANRCKNRNLIQPWKTLSRFRLHFCIMITLLQINLRRRCCNTMVEHTPHNREIVGLNPVRCWAFIASLPSQKCTPNSGPSKKCNTSDFPTKKLYA